VCLSLRTSAGPSCCYPNTGGCKHQYCGWITQPAFVPKWRDNVAYTASTTRSTKATYNWKGWCSNFVACAPLHLSYPLHQVCSFINQIICPVVILQRMGRHGWECGTHASQSFAGVGPSSWPNSFWRRARNRNWHDCCGSWDWSGCGGRALDNWSSFGPGNYVPEAPACTVSSCSCNIDGPEALECAVSTRTSCCAQLLQIVHGWHHGPGIGAGIDGWSGHRWIIWITSWTKGHRISIDRLHI